MGPKLIPGKDAPKMVVTKKDESLYLVYQVNANQLIDMGELDLGIVAKAEDSYSPQLLPLSKLKK